MVANRSIHEPKAKPDDESPLAFSMEGANTGDVGALIPYVWAPGWNSNQAVTRFQLEVGGRLRGGDPGVRLSIGPANGAPEGRVDVESEVTAQELMLLPVHEIFGSDELSALAPAINERMPAPYVAFHPDDAARLGLTAGTGVRGTGMERAAEVRVNAAVPRGIAAYPRGFPGGWTVPPAAVAFEPDPTFAPPVRLIART